MSTDLDHWQNLLNPKNEEERSQVFMEDLELEGREFVSSLRSQIDKELAVIGVEAQLQADMYWAANKSAREEAGENEQGRIGTRVRLINNSLIAEWYRNRFFKEKSTDKKSKVFSTHIKKGRSDRYSMTAFKKEPQWSKETIEIVEERYALLRQRSQALSKIRRALREYERLMNKCHSED